MKSYDELDRLSPYELKQLKTQMKSAVTIVQNKIRKRREYLRSVRYPGYEPNIKGDPEILQLKTNLTEAASELSSMEEYMKIRSSRVKVEEARATLEMHKIELEKAQFDAENKEFISVRNMKAEERRPHGPNVWFGPEFNNIRGAEKRLIVMMAREIGQERYNELRRIAYWDDQHRNNRYYTGSDRFDGKKGLF